MPFSSIAIVIEAKLSTRLLEVEQLEPQEPIPRRIINKSTDFITYTSMVNMMPGSNLYGSTSSAASRSRTRSSHGAGVKGSQNTHTTLSTAAKETSTSGRSTGSGSASSSGSARKSLRKTMMLQKSKRNNGSSNGKSSNATNNSNDANEIAAAGAKPAQASEGLSPIQATIRHLNGRTANRRRAFRGNVGRAVVPSTVEEREAGADYPTFPRPNAANTTSNDATSSSVSAAIHPQSQKQVPQARVAGKGGEGQAVVGEELPKGHVDTILRFYGGDDKSPASLDLYRDVLRVSPEASDREIRIAYFRRGREILGDKGGKTDQRNNAAAKAKANKLDPVTKSRFQAVSMAFEILSKPSWKETYLQQGGLIGKTNNDINSKLSESTVTTRLAVGDSPGSSELDSFSSPSSGVATAFPKTSASGDGVTLQKNQFVLASTTPKTNNGAAQGRQKQLQMPRRLPTALRKSSLGKRLLGTAKSLTERSSSVRWKEHVEELVFANHPNEHASDDESGSNSDGSEHDVFRDVENDEDGRPRRNGPQNSDAFSNGSLSGHSNSRDANTNDSTGGSISSRSRRRRKNKAKIVIDSEELESHLMRMDDEAEKHFVIDFWDNFEESMDGILSLVDAMGGGGGESSKGKNGSKKASTASSWLSTASSINSSSASRYSRGNRDTSIARSLSQDMTISSKTVAEDDGNNEGLWKRSNSLPLPRTSPSILDGVPPSPLPSNNNRLGSVAGSVVTPDEKSAKAGETASDSRASSPFEMMINSWPFQSSKSQEESIQQENQTKISSATITSPVIVSPSPKSKSFKTSIKNKGELSPPSTDLDTIMSVASSILSTSQRRQQSFRPISPTPSEASEAITSDFCTVSLSSPSNQKDDTGNANADAESDQFELQSRLSEMESVDLTELDNPFRSRGPSSSSAPTGASASTDSGLSDVPSNSNIYAKKGQKKKKNRFLVSTISKIRGSPTEKIISSSHDPFESDTSSMCSGISKSGQSVEDVFAGVEEDDQPLQQCDLPDDVKLKVHDISIERVTSHMSNLSELSGSVYSSRRENDDFAANSLLSSSAKNSLPKTTTERSQRSTAYSSCASSTQGGTNSVHSTESKEIDVDGFFDYFTAYATAVMTECANVGASIGVAEYHQDFLGLFSNDASVHKTEIREQPSSMRRVPNENSGSASEI